MPYIFLFYSGPHLPGSSNKIDDQVSIWISLNTCPMVFEVCAKNSTQSADRLITIEQTVRAFMNIGARNHLTVLRNCPNYASGTWRAIGVELHKITRLGNDFMRRLLL